LSPSPNHFDKIMRVDFPVDEPGAYLLEVTAVNGNKDFAVVWLRDVAIVRRRSADGSRFFTFDARTGEPLPSQKLEFFAVAQSWTESPNTGAAQPMTDVAPTTKFYSRQTDETGALFFPKVDANRQINELVEEIIVAIPNDGDPAGSTQYAFLAFQGLWFHGVDPVSGYSLGQGSYASIRFDQEPIAQVKQPSSNSLLPALNSTRLQNRCGRGKRSIFEFSIRTAERLGNKSLRSTNLARQAARLKFPTTRAPTNISFKLAFLRRRRSFWRI
jgi:hypothetical protein